MNQSKIKISIFSSDWLIKCDIYVQNEPEHVVTIGPRATQPSGVICHVRMYYRLHVA